METSKGLVTVDLSGKEKVFGLVVPIVLGVITVLEVVGGSWYVSQNYPFLAARSFERDKLQVEVAVLSETRNYISSAESAQAEGDFFLVNDVLPSEKGVSGLVTRLSEMASRSGVILKNIEFSPGNISGVTATGSAAFAAAEFEEAEFAGGVQAFPLSVSVAGGVEGVLSYLSEIYGAAPLLGVKSISYLGPEEAEKTGRFMVYVFFQPGKMPPVEVLVNDLVLSSEETRVLEALRIKGAVLPGD